MRGWDIINCWSCSAYLSICLW